MYFSFDDLAVLPIQVREEALLPVLADLERNQVNYSAPSLTKLTRVEVAESNLNVLKGSGISVVGSFGGGNVILFDQTGPRLDVQILFNGRPNNVFIFDSDSRLTGTFIIEGGYHVVSVGGKAAHARLFRKVVLRGWRNAFLMGEGGSIGGVGLWIEGEKKAIVIGDDPLFSSDVYIRTADGHAVVDLNTKTIKNRPESVFIDSHVWIGQNAIVLKGVSIGRGCVIGAGAVISKDIPPRSSAAGVPAKVVGRDISWTRQANPDSDVVDRLLSSGLI